MARPRHTKRKPPSQPSQGRTHRILDLGRAAGPQGRTYRVPALVAGGERIASPVSGVSLSVGHKDSANHMAAAGWPWPSARWARRSFHSARPLVTAMDAEAGHGLCTPEARNPESRWREPVIVPPDSGGTPIPSGGEHVASPVGRSASRQGRTYRIPALPRLVCAPASIGE